MYLSACLSNFSIYELFADSVRPPKSLGLYAAQAKADGRSLSTEEWEIDQQINQDMVTLADIRATPDALSKMSPRDYLYFLPSYLAAYNFLQYYSSDNYQPLFVLTETLEGKSGPDRKKVREYTTPEQRARIVGFLYESIDLRSFKTITEVDTRLDAIRFWMD